jgi:hypothetical protein
LKPPLRGGYSAISSVSLAKLRINRASRASAPISSISASTVPSSSRGRRRLSRAVAAALNFARCSWVNFRPRLAFATLPAMAARSSGDLSAQRARPREAIFARVSAVSFFPRFAAESLARVWAECFLPRQKAAVLAIASGDRFRPRRAAALFTTAAGDYLRPRLAADILAIVSALGGFLALAAALSFARCSGENLRSLPEALILAWAMEARSRFMPI